MKTKILTSHKLLQQIERELEQARATTAAEALDHSFELLREQRRFDAVALYTSFDDNAVLISSAGREPQLERFSIAPPARAEETSTRVRMGARTIAELRIASGRELSYPDEVLLKQFARNLARFLISTGKLLMRHAREAQRPATKRESPRKVQPASDHEHAAQSHKAAVGAAARR